MRFFVCLTNLCEGTIQFKLIIIIEKKNNQREYSAFIVILLLKRKNKFVCNNVVSVNDVNVLAVVC